MESICHNKHLVGVLKIDPGGGYLNGGAITVNLNLGNEITCSTSKTWKLRSLGRIQWDGVRVCFFVG
ncbi:MAG: hypothetical protein DMG64_07970 [Acidobacteria bacterium]|nr:MAG: hypothetical protein DMG63_01095 [Acidobacteriota bacterium]PYY03409.1 MAG: hypothetical protein DMG64_07970 [Acidobacteriota bacterium]PYY21385.1 MAG: hypothetical protein DMG62_18790 [Acidobacteriota bacterium]